MKKLLILFILSISFVFYAQVPPYYSSIDFSQSGNSVKNQLANLITNTHSPITYSEVWNVLKVADLETGSTTKVLLIYGYNDGDGNPITDRTRDKSLNGGNVGDWNREHVFAKSLGNPDLGTSGPGSDAHNLRASDVQQNNNRGSKLFATGSGNAGDVSGNWYPGDEFKGDCARIVMYMYLRYGSQCIPSAVGIGSQNSIDPNMVDLFLNWNVEDPVSQFEKDRNDAIQNAQGNRNPFIDNPRIATKIWGGQPAEETWGVIGIEEQITDEIRIYPIPVTNDQFYISGISTLHIESMYISTISGQVVDQFQAQELNANGPIDIDHYQSGTYILSITSEERTIQRKIIIQ